MNNYDFSGWATRNDMRCADGRTIRRNAFAGNDGQTVPLVWQHKHDDPKYVLGHALLENNNDGVYAYCTLNGGPMGRQAAELVANGDVNHLSIYANQLKQSPNGDVMHGVIREVSLVLSGANPGAYIDHCTLTHSGDADFTEAEIYNDFDDGLDLYHDGFEDDSVIDDDFDVVGAFNDLSVKLDVLLQHSGLVVEQNEDGEYEVYHSADFDDEEYEDDEYEYEDDYEDDEYEYESYDDDPVDDEDYE